MMTDPEGARNRFGIVAAAHALLAGGPGGTLTGIRSRIGLTVGL